MTVDRKYCMSSYLMYRTIVDSNKTFSDTVTPNLYPARDINSLDKIKNSDDLYKSLKRQVESACAKKKTAIALSGGIDSAILAKFMPKGTVAYTFKCVVPEIKVIDETPIAEKYAKECGLIHKVIEIYWEDFEKYTPVLMKHKGTPLHSIEIQIYKAALKAKEDGYESIVFGETADANYGGMSGLMSKEWTLGEFIDRYSFLKPYYVLKDFEFIIEPYIKHLKDGYVDVHEFQRDIFLRESMGSYVNACEAAGIELVAPFCNTYWDAPVDYDRIRNNGGGKYVVREVFSKLYNSFEIPAKLPMPRATNEWFKNWSGPIRSEFLPNCVAPLTGDQRWQVWCLEKFLNLID